MTDAVSHHFHAMRTAGAWLLALQVAVFIGLALVDGFDAASNGYPVFVLSTAVLVAGLRRLADRPPNPGAARWLIRSHAVALSMIALGSLAIAFYRFVPQAAPPPSLVPRSLFACMWLMIVLKGVGWGKLKPGSAAGSCAPWTLENRLAWDRAHRAQGRVLFWGGLAGLVSSLAMDPLTSLAWWLATVGMAASAGLYEGWRTRRLGPH
jgi:uncharacterized membrane protein